MSELDHRRKLLAVRLDSRFAVAIESFHVDERSPIPPWPLLVGSPTTQLIATPTVSPSRRDDAGEVGRPTIFKAPLTGIVFALETEPPPAIREVTEQGPRPVSFTPWV